MSLRVPGGVIAWMAVTIVGAYALGWAGVALVPTLVVAIGLAAGVFIGRRLHADTDTAAGQDDVLWPWALVVVATGTALVGPVWPELLPPGGGSDVVHHLALVDVIERTRHLVDGEASGPVLGEMAHYTPGLHLLIVIVASLVGVDAFRVVYPLVIATVALKAGFLFLIAHRLLAGAPGRTPLAMAVMPLVLFAPGAYSLGGFLHHGFLAQVGAELFVVAGWWALAGWWSTPCVARMALVGLCGAGTFLVWPIWIGPLIMAAAMAVALAPRMDARTRVIHGLIAVVPVAIVAALHLARHAAWLRMASTSGAVPAFVPGLPGWTLIALAGFALVFAARMPSARVTLFFLGGVVLQGAALFVLARMRGAETPYMAMKMIYLGVYPVAVLAALVIGLAVAWFPGRLASPVGWASAALVAVAAVRIAEGIAVPAPIVSLDLYRAGRWARASLEPACVDYVVANAEQAYWLHLAVMGQSRSSPRTSDIDGYTANRAVGRWVEGARLPYAVATFDLLPGEVLGDAEVEHRSGTAVVIKRGDADVDCSRR
jgi:hypothetical protein